MQIPPALQSPPLKIEHPRRDPVYDAADISAYARKLLFDVALDMFGHLWDNYVTYEIDSVEEHEDSLVSWSSYTDDLTDWEPFSALDSVKALAREMHSILEGMR